MIMKFSWYMRSLSTLLLLAGVWSVVPSDVIAQQFNQQINYQGKLANSSGVAVADGTYQMVFRLYTVATSGTAIWTEAWAGVNEVPVVNGLFSVMLGTSSSTSNINFNQTLYLGVTIEGDSEMTPRKILGAVPAAFEAKNSQTVGGVASTSLVRNDQASTISTSTASTLLTVTQNGVGDILNLFDGGTEVFSVIDGGNVGIGSTTPGARLSVNGSGFFGGNLTATGTLNITGLSTLGLLTATNATTTNLFATSTNFVSATTTNLSTTNLTVTGAFRDSAASTGTLGMILQSTGTSTRWVATSTIGSYYLNRANHTGTQATSTITGVFGVANGGTGSSSFTNNRLLTGNGSNALVDEANLTFDGSTLAVTGALTVSGNTTFSGLIASRALFLDSSNRATTTGALANLISSLSDVNGSTGSSNLVLSTSPAFAGTATFSALTATGTATFTTVDINGGSIDGTAIGAAAANTGIFTNATTTNLFATSTNFVSATTTNLRLTNLTIGSNAFIRTGAHNLTLTTGGTTDVTLPATGTLSTLTGAETLTNKSLTSPTITGTGNATFANATTSTNFTLSGTLRDSAMASGTLGMVLQSTGTSTRWVATSSLGFASSFSNSLQLSNLLSDEVGTGLAVFNTSPAFAGTATFNSLTATGTLTVSTSSAGTSVDMFTLINTGGTNGAAARMYLSGSNNITRSAYIEGINVEATNQNEHALAFGVSDQGAAPTEAMRINYNGRVAIGTTSPASLLHIYSSSSAVATALSTIENGGTGDSHLRFLLTGGAAYTMGIDNSDSDKFKISYSSTGGGALGSSDRFIIDTDGSVGINDNTPTALLNLGGTYTTSNTDMILLSGTLTSDALTQRGVNMDTAFSPNPSVGTLTSAIGIASTPNLANATTTISNYYGVFTRLDAASTYTGSVTNAFGYLAADPGSNNNSPQPYTNYYAFRSATITNGNGATSTNVTNYGFSLNGITAAASTSNSATVTNYGIYLTKPSGDTASTSNYGLYINDVGGVNAANNFSVYNNSTADSYFAGNIGLGTTSPATKLHIYGGDLTMDRGSTINTLSRDLNIGGARNGGGNTFAEINFYNYDSNGAALDYIGAAIRAQNEEGSTDTDAGELGFFTSTSTSGLTERMTITAAGNVGIGSTTPAALLGVNGSGFFGGNLTATGTIYASVGVGVGTSAIGSNMLSVVGNVRTVNVTNTGSLSIVSSSTNSSTAFSVTSADTLSSRYVAEFLSNSGATTGMVITAAGNVGIGSTTPAALLGVNGSGFFGGNLTATGTLNITGLSTLGLLTATNATTTNLFATSTNFVSATTTNLSTTNLTVTGAFRDSAASTGTLGMILQSTGTSTRWVATSSLGISANLLDGIDSTSFLRSDASDSFTGANTLDFAAATTLDINGSLSIATTSIVFDGASTNFNLTGDLTINTNDLVVNKSTGNVGVGTTTPTSVLAVNSSSGDNVPAFSVNGGGDAATEYVGYLLGRSSSFNSTVLRLASNRVSSTGYNFIEAVIDEDGTPETAFIVRGNGTVGIGTTSPAGLLDVTGGNMYLTDTANTGMRFYFKNASTQWYLQNASGSFRLVDAESASTPFLVEDAAPDNSLRVYSSGDVAMLGGSVGIGAASPRTTLNVVSSDGNGVFVTGNGTNTSPYFRLTELATDYRGGYLMDDGINNVFNIGVHSTANSATSSDVHAISIPRGTGFVGIGTTSPLARLHIRNADSGISSLSAQADNVFIEGSGNAGMTIGSGVSGSGSIYFGDSGSSSVGRIVYDHSNDDLNFWTNNSRNLVINSVGNVGIGTTTPSQILSISSASGLSGATPVSISVNSTSNGTWTDESIMSQLLFESSDTNGGAGARGAIRSYVDDTTGADFGLSFWTTTAGSGGLTEQMRIDHAGNVGIGSTTPNFKLSVNGTSALVGTANINTSGTAATLIGNTTGALTLTSGGSAVFDVNNNSATAYRLRSGSAGTAYYTMDTRSATVNAVGHTFTTDAPTIARTGNTNVFTLASFNPADVTWTGTTGMTSATAAGSNKSVYFDQPTIVWATASNTTIANASNVAINGATQAQNNAGSTLTITNSSALRIFGAAATGTGGAVTNSYGLYVDASSNATNNFAAVFNGGNVGIGTTSPTTLLSVAGSIKSTGSIDADVQFLGQPSDTTSAPSFSWTTDTDTGMYRPTLDTIGFVTSGFSRLNITASGSVGIGSTTPAALLGVNGSGFFGGNLTATGTLNITGLSTLGLLTATNATTTNFAVTGTSSFASSLILSGSAANIALGSNYLSGDGGDEGIFIDSSGNVGLGTTTPSNRLELVSAGAVSAMLVGTIPSLQLQESDASVDNRRIRIVHDGGGLLVQALTDAGSGGGNNIFIPRTGNSIDGINLRSSGATSTFLSTNGSSYFLNALGIGSTTPAALLGVNGSGFFGGNLTATGTLTISGATTVGSLTTSGTLAVSASSSGNSVDMFTLINTAGTSGSAARMYLSGDSISRSTYIEGINVEATNGNEHALAFGVSDSASAPTEAMRIDYNGRVGIGTTSPASMLHIHSSSSVVATALATIQQNGSGDSQLRFSLTGVAAYTMGIDNSDDNKFKISYGATGGGGLGANDRFVIDESGNVGIGTSTPLALLQISSSSNPILRIDNLDASVEIGETLGSIEFYSNDTSSNGINVGSSLLSVAENAGSIYSLAFTTLNGASGNTEKMRITGDGDVGIGTTSPSSLLTVAGDGRFTGVLYSGNPTSIITPATGDVLIGGTAGTMQFDQSTANMYIAGGSANPSVFGYRSAGTTNSPTTISSGNDLLVLAGFGYDGNSYEKAGQITFDSTGTTSDGIVPGLMRFYTADASGTLTQAIHITAEQFVGIAMGAGVNAQTELHVRNGAPEVRIEGTNAGTASVASTSAGINLVSPSMNNTTQQYGSGLRFSSTDSAFTVESPKFLAGIFPRATETYLTDIDGGMALDFFTSPNDVGTSSAPQLRMTINQDGFVGIGSTTPAALLGVNGSGFFAGNLTATGTLNITGASTLGLLTATNATTTNFFATSTRFISATTTNLSITSASTTNLLAVSATTTFLTASSLTSGRIVYSTTSGRLTDNTNFTFNGTNLVLGGTVGVQFGGDALINRGAANRLDLASGDTFNIISGALSIGGSTVISSTSLHFAATGTAVAGNLSYSFATDTDTGIFSPAANTLGFVTGGTQRAMLNSSGIFGIGSSTPSSGLTVDFAGGSGYAAYIKNNSTTNDGDVLALQMGDTTLGSGNLYIDFLNASGTSIGNISASGTSAVAYNTTSDVRLKENFATSTYGLDTLLSVQVLNYNYKRDPNSLSNGFVAQQLYEFYPFAVTRPDNDENGYWSVDYGKVSPLLAKSIQDQYKSIDELLRTGTTTATSSIFGEIRDGVVDTVWEKLVVVADGLKDGVLELAGFKADKVETEELCVGSTCITEAELLELLNNAGSQAASPSSAQDVGDGGNSTNGNTVADDSTSDDGSELSTDASEESGDDSGAGDETDNSSSAEENSSGDSGEATSGEGDSSTGV